MKTLSFKEYIESKSQLHTAIQQDPIHVGVYEVYKYCRIATGQTKQLREYYNLKPKQLIRVKWKYHDIDQLPDPMGVTIPHLNESEDRDVLIPVFHTGERLIKWLQTNTKELS